MISPLKGIAPTTVIVKPCAAGNKKRDRDTAAEA
jgi:hypothetical protein